MYIKLKTNFFERDVLDVAPDLLGKYLVVLLNSGLKTFRITDTEAYRGTEDQACHARKGRTKRTEVMFWQGGTIYVYLIYGIHWMLNIVTGPVNEPQAVLIRGVDEASGPGRVGKLMNVNNSWNGDNICNSDTIWVEDRKEKPQWESGPRIGIDYAGDYWKNINWRFFIKDK